MSRSLRVTLLLLIAAAYAWRVQGLTAQSLWRDEVDAIYFATRHLPDTLSMFVRAGQNGPLFFLALRPWFAATGTSEFALRYISVLAGTLSVPLLWQVARRLAPPPLEQAAIAPVADPAALSAPLSFPLRTPRPLRLNLSPHAVPLLAATFLALNPYQLWYSQEGKMYTTVTALALLATLLFWEGVSRGGWRPWLGYLLTVSVALYTHLLLILLYPLHFVWFLLAWPLSRRHWRGYTLAMAGLTLPYVPMLWWQWDLLTSSQQMTGFARHAAAGDVAHAAAQPQPWLYAAGRAIMDGADLLLGRGGHLARRGRDRRVSPARRRRGGGRPGALAAAGAAARAGCWRRSC